MNRLFLTVLSGYLLIGINHTRAASPAATVTQTFDRSTHTLSATASGDPATSGTVLRDGEYLKTGKKSLAEILLANKTVTRLGPNTVFTYSSVAHVADLQSGTILFSKPKDGQALTLKMAGVTALVTGTTGFVEKEGNNVVFGVVEGTVHVTVGTASAVLHAGKMLVTAGLNGQVVSFDVPNFVSSSPFFSRFQGQLPNEKYIAHEIAEYNNLAARGFIEPVQATPTKADRPGEVAANKSAGHDAAGNPIATSAAAGPSVAGTGGSIVSSGGFTVSGATLNMNGASTSSALALNGSASGAGLTKAGAGTGVLAGANTYSGATTVNSGVLTISGATTGGVLATTSGTLAAGGLSSGYHGTTTITSGTISGATLSLGTGTITGGTNISVGTGTITSGGANLNLNGSGVGTITINGGTTLSFGNRATPPPGTTIVNNGNTPITVGGITIQPHSTGTIPH